jgi:phosphoglycerate dehydrogenase-like enzyme
MLGGNVKRTTVLVSLCRSEDDEKLLNKIVQEELGPEAEMVDIIASRTKDQFQKELKKAEVLFCHRLPSDYGTYNTSSASRLKWLHLAAASADFCVKTGEKLDNVLVTNSRGLHSTRAAEYVIGAMIAYTKGFLKYREKQHEKKWAHEELLRSNKTLAGKTLGILGLGAVGKSVAKVAAPLGLEILALRRHPEDYPVPPEVSRVFGPQNLREFIHPLDYLVICLPHTVETHHIIDRHELVRLKTNSLLINISRGGVIDEKALIESLRDGEVGGAVLDVFEKEPLPQNSPLWDMENVFITPHVAGNCPSILASASRIFARNLRNYLEKRTLDNIVDQKLGY